MAEHAFGRGKTKRSERPSNVKGCYARERGGSGFLRTVIKTIRKCFPCLCCASRSPCSRSRLQCGCDAGARALLIGRAHRRGWRDWADTPTERQHQGTPDDVRSVHIDHSRTVGRRHHRTLSRAAGRLRFDGGRRALLRRQHTCRVPNRSATQYVDRPTQRVARPASPPGGSKG